MVYSDSRQRATQMYFDQPSGALSFSISDRINAISHSGLVFISSRLYVGSFAV